MTDDGIIKSKPLHAIVEARDRILALVKEIIAKQEEIDRLAQGTIGETIWSNISNRGYFDSESSKATVDKRFWHFLVESSQLCRAMTEKAKTDLYAKIEKEPPEFSLAEVETYSAGLQQLYADNGMQTIKEIYHALIGCKYHDGGYGWKVDNLRAVKPCFKCSWEIRWDAFFNQFRAESWYGNGCKFEDLLTACYLLDTGIRPDYASTFKKLADEDFKTSNQVETPYFIVTAHKNKNQTVNWKKEKLEVLALLNKYGSDGTRLPDHMSKRYKPEHFER